MSESHQSPRDPFEAPDPASLHIVHYPDPVLRHRSTDVPQVTPALGSIAERMVTLMLEAPGIGLAAPQVGLPWRMFVCHVPPDRDEQDAVAEGQAQTFTPRPIVCINPVLSEPEGPLESATEGCLSLPEITGDVLRPRSITLTALDAAGEPFTIRASGLLARCFQHETDHLDGVLILDRMSHLSRLRTRSAVRLLERAAR